MAFGLVSGPVDPWASLRESGNSEKVFVSVAVTASLVSVASTVDIGVDGYTKDFADYSNGVVGYLNVDYS